LSLAVVRDLRDVRSPAGPDELAAFETDVLAGFVAVFTTCNGIRDAPLYWANGQEEIRSRSTSSGLGLSPLDTPAT
jgi:hypothetical protein